MTSSSKKKRYACHKKLVFGEQQNSWGYPTIRCPAGGEAKKEHGEEAFMGSGRPHYPSDNGMSARNELELQRSQRVAYCK